MPDPAPDLLQTFLSDRDSPCPGCGYNLRGLTTSTCPECGDALVLRVGLEEPRQGAFLAGLVGLAASAGFNALIVLMWLMTILRGRGPNSGFNEPWLWYSFGAFVIAGILLCLWLLSRRRIRRLSAPTRRLAAAACWATTLLNAFLFSVFIR